MPFPVQNLGKFFKQQVYYEQAFPDRAWILVKDLDYLIYDINTVGVNELGQSETSDVVEFRPKKKPSKLLLFPRKLS